jgi:hypothetical protein
MRLSHGGRIFIIDSARSISFNICGGQLEIFVKAALKWKNLLKFVLSVACTEKNMTVVKEEHE